MAYVTEQLNLRGLMFFVREDGAQIEVATECWHVVFVPLPFQFASVPILWADVQWVLAGDFLREPWHCERGSVLGGRGELDTIQPSCIT